jgi:F-type H+-transporting ATPase subunit epsilon
VTASNSTERLTFVVLGGIAEFSSEKLTILAEFASHVADFDVAELRARISEMEEGLAGMPVSEELDRAVARLDHYRSVEASLNAATAF